MNHNTANAIPPQFQGAKVILNAIICGFTDLSCPPPLHALAVVWAKPLELAVAKNQWDKPVRNGRFMVTCFYFGEQQTCEKHTK
jgi:hypothetical protein